MKTLYTLFFIFILTPSFSQKVEIIKNEIPQYQGVVHVEGYTSDDLYNALRARVALSYNSAQHVIQMDDKVSNKIVVKGIETYNFKLMSATVPNQFDYTLLLELRDNRFRYTYEVVKATTGSGEMEMLNSILLADHPYDTNGITYKGKTLGRVNKQKLYHLEKIEEYKEVLIISMIAAVRQSKEVEDW